MSTNMDELYRLVEIVLQPHLSKGMKTHESLLLRNQIVADLIQKEVDVAKLRSELRTWLNEGQNKVAKRPPS
jgi:hypothetical protein